jgi:hypothetical protein
MIKLVDYILIISILLVSILIGFQFRLSKFFKSKHTKKQALNKQTNTTQNAQKKTARQESTNSAKSNNNSSSQVFDNDNNSQNYDTITSKKFAKFYIETINSFSEFEQLNEEYLEAHKNEPSIIPVNQKKSLTVIEETNTKNDNNPGGFSVILNSFHLALSFFSSIFILGIPIEFFFYGFKSLQYSFHLFFASLFIAYFLVPFLYKIKSNNIFDYLEGKFDTNNNNVKYFTLFIAIAFQLIYSSLLLYSISLFIKPIVISNYPIIELWMIVSSIVVLSALLACLGLRSVRSLFLTQSLVFIISLLVFMFFSIKDYDSKSLSVNFDSIWSEIKNENRSQLIIFDENLKSRYTLLNTIFGQFVTAVSAFALNQEAFKRIKNTKSAQKAQLVFLSLAPLGFLLLLILTIFSGIVFVYVSKHESSLNNPGYLIGKFVADFSTNYTGLYGVLLGLLLSFSLSALTNSLRSVSVYLIDGILKKTLLRNKSVNDLNEINRDNSMIRRQRIMSEKQIDLLYAQELHNINIKNSTKTNSKMFYEFKKKKLGVLAAWEKRFKCFVILLFSSLVVLIAIMLDSMPDNSLISITMSLLNPLHPPIVFIFMCAKFNEYSLKRFKFGHNIGRRSKLKNFQFKSNDVILSCLIAICSIYAIYACRLNYHYVEHMINSIQQYPNSSQLIEINTIQNQTSSGLNLLINLSFNWYSLVGFLTCLLVLFILNLLRFVLGNLLLKIFEKLNCCSLLCKYESTVKTSNSKPKLVFSIDD